MAHKLIDLLKRLDDDARVHAGLTICEPHCLIRALTDQGFEDEARYCLEPHRIVRLNDQGGQEGPAVYTVDRYPDAKDVQKSVFDIVEAMAGEQQEEYSALLRGAAFGSCKSIRAFIENHAEDGDSAERIAELYVKAAL